MDIKNVINDKIGKLDETFENLIKERKLNINSLESLAISGIDDIKVIVNNHIEELL